MPSQKGRDLLLKIGDGGSPEAFTTIGAARTAALTLNNQPVDATSMDGGGLQEMRADAGLQSMQIRLDGIFKDSAAEELLRAAAFGRATCNYLLAFPNGDVYAAPFVVDSYARGGSYDGVETFSVALVRAGAGAWTPGE
jgi:TP901-1 family phage major tail protein